MGTACQVASKDPRTQIANQQEQDDKAADYFEAAGAVVANTEPNTAAVDSHGESTLGDLQVVEGSQAVSSCPILQLQDTEDIVSMSADMLSDIVSVRTGAAASSDNAQCVHDSQHVACILLHH
jgi:hypothetical protein